MARRSKKRKSTDNNPLLIYGILTVAVILALVIGKNFLNKRAEHFAELSNFPISDYQTNPNSLSGNQYKVFGKITEKLKWTPHSGQLISLLVETDKNTKNKTTSAKGTIGIFIPSDVSKLNLERGHSYLFKININREGLPVALDIIAE